MKELDKVTKLLNALAGSLLVEVKREGKVWQQRYAAKGVLVIGIHTPETDAESKPANVAKKVKELGITYPVLVDSRRYNWNRWRQHIWPSIYLVDKQGRVKYVWEGELEYQGAGGEAKMTRLIETLLSE